MELKQIISRRFNTKQIYRDIVYEWEDIIASELNYQIAKDNLFRDNRVIRNIKWGGLFTGSDNSFVFEMSPGEHSGFNKKNFIPFIIDFYVRNPKYLNVFYKKYSNNRVVIVSSKEVYDFLKTVECPLPIYHIALSLSDKYAISAQTKFKKEYDLVMVGRQNKILKGFVDRYSKTHPDFYYVYQETTENGTIVKTNKEEGLPNIETREKYMTLLKKAKSVLYSTPGMDDMNGYSQNFNQVTPRLLEYMASGCHILARYPINSDVEFYELPSWLPSLQTYEDFERAMNKARTTEVDMMFYSQYLSKHYTSVRAKELKSLFDRI